MDGRALEERRRPQRRQPAGGWLRKVAWFVVPLALLGELGHQLFERLAQSLAHHFFHVVFAGGAVLAFGLYAIADIRRNGWPRFSWHLRPTDDGRHPQRT